MPSHASSVATQRLHAAAPVGLDHLEPTSKNSRKCAASNREIQNESPSRAPGCERVFLSGVVSLPPSPWALQSLHESFFQLSGGLGLTSALNGSLTPTTRPLPPGVASATSHSRRFSSPSCRAPLRPALRRSNYLVLSFCFFSMCQFCLCRIVTSFPF